MPSVIIIQFKKKFKKFKKIQKMQTIPCITYADNTKIYYKKKPH
jgi:hypothetical protein